MAPEPPSDAGWPDPPNNAEDFMNDLTQFHAIRGTNLDPHPKVNGKLIDLFELFQVVQGKGGYDAVSAEKLLWRKICGDFGLGNHNAAAYAFALKTAFYRNLAAYAIKRVYKKEPPPKEILEQLTAKGGDLLSRTVDNFRTPHSRDQLVNGHESDGSDGHRTPKQERLDGEELGSGTRTRGLRQAPPQRTPYQPDVSSTRQSRHSSSQAQLPQPTAPPVTNNYASPAYNSTPLAHRGGTELDRQASVNLRPVYTPSNDPIRFHERLKRLQEEEIAKQRRSAPARPIMLPGTGFDGPNIYVRTLMALKCGIPQEVDYALHHLVKISHERGDKYKFEAFPGLLDGLIAKVLEICSLFYDVKWEVSYTGEESLPAHCLDGLSGTPDILDRIQKLKQLEDSEYLQTAEFSHTLLKCHEAGLVIRNMSMLEENARHLSEHWPLRDFLSIALNLPKSDSVIEMKHYALDIAEQVTKYWSLSSSDPLYISLIQTVTETTDRGAALAGLRALCRISMALPESKRSKPVDIPEEMLKILFNWTLVNDDEIVNCCLDFLYQYTFVPENVKSLLSASSQGTLSLEALTKQLGTLLMSHTKLRIQQQTVQTPTDEPPVTDIPELPREYLDSIMDISEPERSKIWLRACFEEDPGRDVTQLALWQAYQGRFTPYAQQPKAALLPAADFIKNVSATFNNANAQVINDTTGTQRFIIKGIRPRGVPIDQSGRLLARCLWNPPGSYRPCGIYRMSAEDMFEHVVESHVGVMRDSAGQWDLEDARSNAVNQQHRFNCHWARCQHYHDTNGTTELVALGVHLKTHLPAGGDRAAPHRASSSKHPLASGSSDDLDPSGGPAVVKRMRYHDTTLEASHDLAGLPLTSALVLRNLARTIPLALAAPEGGDTAAAAAQTREWTERLFMPLRQRFLLVLAHNRSLGAQMYDLLQLIEKGLHA